MTTVRTMNQGVYCLGVLKPRWVSGKVLYERKDVLYGFGASPITYANATHISVSAQRLHNHKNPVVIKAVIQHLVSRLSGFHG